MWTLNLLLLDFCEFCHVQLVILMRSSPPLMKEIVCLDVFCWIRTLSWVAAYTSAVQQALSISDLCICIGKEGMVIFGLRCTLDCCCFAPSRLFEGSAVCLLHIIFYIHGLYWSSEVKAFWADKWASRCKICDMDILGII